MGALGVTISTDKTVYKIGEKPTYRISGGTPKAHVAWTSFKNGQPTGEFQADYPGDDLNDGGTLTVQGAPWTASDVGSWQKQVLIVPEGYAGDESQLATGIVEFTVSATDTAAKKPTAGTSSSQSLLDKKVNLPGVGSFPLILIGGVVLAFFAFKGKK
jgi:hypothetical protein